MATQVRKHSCLAQEVASSVISMNVYERVSPLILQGLAQGTMCTQWRTCVRPEVMCMQQHLTFLTWQQGNMTTWQLGNLANW